MCLSARIYTHLSVCNLAKINLGYILRNILLIFQSNWSLMIAKYHHFNDFLLNISAFINLLYFTNLFDYSIKSTSHHYLYWKYNTENSEIIIFLFCLGCDILADSYIPGSCRISPHCVSVWCIGVQFQNSVFVYYHVFLVSIFIHCILKFSISDFN